jgi:hypothetical protein
MTLTAFLYPTAMQINALTAVLIPPPPPVLFRVDHPFVALIVDGPNKLPLMVSRVTDPTT